MIQLRDYQAEGVETGVNFLSSTDPGSRLCLASPCGTGKSYVLLDIMARLARSHLLTPSVEIIDGLVAKGGDLRRIWTPLGYRNALMRGDVAPPSALLIDEAHHGTADTYDTIRILTDACPALGVTATPFRGTPQGTATFQEFWGEVRWLISLRDAEQREFVTIPECSTIPVLDDDVIEVTKGEFNVRRVQSETDWKLAQSVVNDARNGPTVVSVSSVRSAEFLAELLREAGTPAVAITCDTGRTERRAAFDQVRIGALVLVQVNVVSEGVDLPIRTLIDFAPTLSPVKWLQQLGRAMRPGGVSRYVCCNRNLLRHAYLLEGLVPPQSIAQAQGAFPDVSSRSGYRAFGLEGVGRLKPAIVPLADGTKGSAFYVRDAGDLRTEYVAIVLPTQLAPLWAKREVDRSSEVYRYGKWSLTPSPKELTGFASVPPKALSPKQEAWWKRSAAAFGLNPDAEVDAKVFGVLPVLCDTGLRIAS